MKRLQGLRNASALLAVCCVVAYGGFAATDAFLRTSPRRILIKAPIPTGANLEAVFVGSSTCHASRSPTLPRELRTVLSILRDSATSAGAQFASVGVAIDWDVAAGIRWLKRVGDFDEVVAGRNWANLGAFDYLWSDSSATPVLPQLILAVRTVTADTARVVATRPRVVLRLLGEGAIKNWADAHIGGARPLDWEHDALR